MRSRCRGSALIEFALAWPVALLLVLAAVQLAFWSVESFAARAAALAGARAGSVAGAGPDFAEEVAARAMGPAVFGTTIQVSCDAVRQSQLRVCARRLSDAVEVDIDGAVPALVPLIGGGGLPIAAHVSMPKEAFSR